ncbi:MAG: hypothetical protein ACJZ49_00165 [Candidatus Thalassarchaeaceae archaeon]|tara:strand:+ start:257 stop:1144 length:888 start_codon:yes stop_codon:yes gene_type:complete
MADDPVEAELVGDKSLQRHSSISEKIAKLYPIGRKPDSTKSQLLRAVWMSTIMITIPFVAAMPLLNPEPEMEVEDWYAEWATQSWSTEVGQTISSGSRVEAMVTVDQGGLIGANYSVEMQGGSFAGLDCEPKWLVEVRSPDPVNYSDGSNSTSWSGQDWEGSDSVIIDTPVPEIEATSSDELQETIFLLRSDTQVWMHGKGEWLLSVTNQGSEGTLGNCGGQQVTFQINLTVTNWREPRFADGDFNFTTSTVGGGTPIGTYVTLGGAVPLLLIATVVSLGLRKLDVDGEQITESE